MLCVCVREEVIDEEEFKKCLVCSQAWQLKIYKKLTLAKNFLLDVSATAVAFLRE